MKVLIDTNIILDVLEKREPFFEDSYRIIQLGLEGDIDTIMSAGAVTDVYYLIRQFLKDPVKARESIFVLSNFIKICSSASDDITKALVLFIPDFEDAVLAVIAKREKADFIITRNEEDFVNSPVPAKTPALFLREYKTWYKYGIIQK